MKHKILFAFAFLTTLGMNSQTIINGGFESWNTSTMDNLNYYPVTSNPSAIQLGLPLNALKVADPQQGALAIKLITEASATDTMFGFFSSGDPGNMTGGIPYNQHPITLTGYYKSDVMPGDTAIFLVVFKEAGVLVSMDVAIFTGLHNTYTPFSVTLSIPALANPDSVIIAAASSNAFVNNGIPGSMLQIDNISFTGVPTQPANMNGSFENWTSVNTSTPQNWGTAGDLTFQTTDAHAGSYALQMTTIQYDPNNFGPSYAANGTFGPMGPVGGRPYSLMTDTLCGWYKFIPNGVDSATLWISATQNTAGVGGAYVALAPASTYTFFSIPFSSGAQPDTLMVLFASTYANTLLSNVGSVLKVDDIYLKSSLVGTGPELTWNVFGQVQLYPNPSNGDVWMEWNNNNTTPVVMTITDAIGKTISSSEYAGMGHQKEHIDTSVLSKGVYVITISQGANHMSRKLFVQ